MNPMRTSRTILWLEFLKTARVARSPRSVRGSTEWGVATSMESPTLRNTRAEIRSSLLGADKRWAKSVSGYGSRA